MKLLKPIPFYLTNLILSRQKNSFFHFDLLALEVIQVFKKSMISSRECFLIGSKIRNKNISGSSFAYLSLQKRKKTRAKFRLKLKTTRYKIMFTMVNV